MNDYECHYYCWPSWGRNNGKNHWEVLSQFAHLITPSDLLVNKLYWWHFILHCLNVNLSDDVVVGKGINGQQFCHNFNVNFKDIEIGKQKPMKKMNLLMRTMVNSSNNDNFAVKVSVHQDVYTTNNIGNFNFLVPFKWKSCTQRSTFKH